MKTISILSVVLLSVVTTCLSAGTRGPDSAHAVLWGKITAPLPIILADDVSPNTVQATKELARVIGLISGKTPEILDRQHYKAGSKAIWIGHHPDLLRTFPGADLSFSKPEEILILSGGGSVAILGNDRMINGTETMSGTANAVYTFIQRNLGVRWLWPGTLGEVIPKTDVLSIAPEVFRFAPAFLQRDLFIMEHTWFAGLKEWNTRQRLQLDSFESPPGHGFDDWWERYHVSHPEYFALQPDGTRSGFPEPGYAKVCEGEPGVWRQWVENVSAALKESPSQQAFAASQNDGSNMGICMDPRSVAWDQPGAPLYRYIWNGKVEDYVTMSDRSVRFWNILGEKLREAHPDKDLRVVGMAYGPAKPPPIKAVAADNVVIGFVGHFPMSSDALRQSEREEFAAWMKVAKYTVFRPNLFWYSGGFMGLPTLSTKAAGEDLRFLAENSCKGIVVDLAPQHWATQGLQYYVLAQLFWDPFQDSADLVRDFCESGFGPAAPELERYFHLLETAQRATVNHPQWRAGMGIQATLADPILPATYSEEILGECDMLLTQAGAKLASAPEDQRLRLDFIRRGQEFTRLTMKIVLAMNRVRSSQGKDFEAVEQAISLCKKRDAFLAEEDKKASASRHPALHSHRIQVSWIEGRAQGDILGP
ncbi:MAG: DUF4838 domain-containing protein, partial [Verrucomicrobiota bacterium]